MGTIKNRHGDVQQMARWTEQQTGRPFHVRDFVTNEMQRYQDWLAATFHESTVKRRLSSLRLFLEWARNEGSVEEEACLVVERRKIRAAHSHAPQSLPPLTTAEMERLYQMADAAGDIQASLALRLIGSNGLRISELCALKWKDIKVINDLAIISFGQGSGLKSGDIPLRAECRKAIAKLCKSDRPPGNSAVFHGKAGTTTRRAVEMMIERYSKVAGLKDVTSKTLRLSFVVNLLESAIQPSEIALHAGSWITNLTRYREVVPFRNLESQFPETRSRRKRD